MPWFLICCKKLLLWYIFKCCVIIDSFLFMFLCFTSVKCFENILHYKATYIFLNAAILHLEIIKKKRWFSMAAKKKSPPKQWKHRYSNCLQMEHVSGKDINNGLIIKQCLLFLTSIITICLMSENQSNCSLGRKKNHLSVQNFARNCMWFVINWLSEKDMKPCSESKWKEMYHLLRIIFPQRHMKEEQEWLGNQNDCVA